MCRPSTCMRADLWPKRRDKRRAGRQRAGATNSSGQQGPFKHDRVYHIGHLYPHLAVRRPRTRMCADLWAKRPMAVTGQGPLTVAGNRDHSSVTLRTNRTAHLESPVTPPGKRYSPEAYGLTITQSLPTYYPTITQPITQLLPNPLFIAICVSNE